MGTGISYGDVWNKSHQGVHAVSQVITTDNMAVQIALCTDSFEKYHTVVTNSVAFSLQVNYTDWATAPCCTTNSKGKPTNSIKHVKYNSRNFETSSHLKKLNVKIWVLCWPNLNSLLLWWWRQQSPKS
jgi:hypothetical protein